MPEQQFLAFAAQIVQVANVVTVAVHVIEDDATGSGALDIFAQILSGELADAAIGFNGPINRAKAFFCCDDAFEGGDEVAALEVFFDQVLVLRTQIRWIDDQANFFVPTVANAQEMVAIGERKRAHDADLRKGAIFFDRQPQSRAVLEKAQFLWIEKDQSRSLDKCDRRFFGFFLDGGRVIHSRTNNALSWKLLKQLVSIRGAEPPR